jgi:hypothetical protein
VLKFGIICESMSVPRWQAECLHALLASGIAKPALVVIERDAAVRAGRRGSLGFWLFGAWCRAVVHPRVDALRPTPIEVDAPVRSILCVSDGGRGLQHYRPEDVAAIEAHRLDFMVRFKSSGLSGAVLSAARWGIWSYRHGDGRFYRGTPPGFWELRRAEPVLETALERITDEKAGRAILHRGAFRTRPTYARTLDEALLGSADWAARTARELNLGETRRVAPPKPTRVDGLPTSFDLLLYLAVRGAAIFRGLARKLLRREDWNIGVIDQPLKDLVEGAPPAPVTWFPDPPRGGFLADPFPFRRQGETYVLAEEYVHRTRKGHIAAIRMVDGKFAAGLATVLRSPHHLSYPFLFTWNGETYCVPERSEGGGVPLYRAVRFPGEWEYVRTLIEGFPALDSTIFEHDGLWWLFCTRAGGSSEYKLHAWHAATPLGPWTPHALNPLKCDVRSSRPAGPAFRIGEDLYRPAQDGSRSYGGAIAFNRVKRLTPTSFKEETVGRLVPDPAGRYPDGLHTICDIGGLTIVDGKRYRPISPFVRG